MKILILFCVIMFVVSSVAYAETDLEKLTNAAKQINTQMVKLSGANTLNDALIRDAGIRSARYDESLTKLREQLDKINAAIDELNTAPITEPAE